MEYLKEQIEWVYGNEKTIKYILPVSAPESTQEFSSLDWNVVQRLIALDNEEKVNVVVKFLNENNIFTQLLDCGGKEEEKEEANESLPEEFLNAFTGINQLLPLNHLATLWSFVNEEKVDLKTIQNSDSEEIKTIINSWKNIPDYQQNEAKGVVRNFLERQWCNIDEKKIIVAAVPGRGVLKGKTKPKND